jgi:LCP family protein required for cell wall assembly
MINSVYTAGYYRASYDGKKGDEAKKAGMEYLADMIQYTFAVNIDYYFFVELDGFKFLVDAVGGVYMDVPVRMEYTDPFQNLYINLQPGFQLLDGNKAEQLIRFANYIEKDMDRIITQQKFLAALIKKILGEFDINTIQNLVETVTNYTVSDISTIDMAYFAKEAFNVKSENIRMSKMEKMEKMK